MVMVGVDSAHEVRSITILGSTGSVGCSTVGLIEAERERYVVEAITANRNVDRLAEQARRLRPRLAVIADEGLYSELKVALAGTGVESAAGASGLLEAADMPAERVMAAIVGAAGLAPILTSVRRGATVALANKECLVCAGELMLGEVAHHGATLLPVDSEHNAIFQVFDFDQPERVEKIVLTASGGPFRKADTAAMAMATPKQAVAHPNWDMGAKVSVDSATMMNKGLEMIEALHLFPISAGQIEVLIHPQSVVHSMVGYCDGSVLAQLGSPDMRTPIAYSLAWPQRMEVPVPRLNLVDIASLTFEAPDETRFPALRLAAAALRSPSGFATAMNAANEVAVQGFLNERLGFLDIIATVERTLQALEPGAVSSLEDVDAIDSAARRVAAGFINGA
ncbi:MAG: 1-deoxy-D-xylulose-5-phosphate reductoisomerase [Alphaproteobacteria bacterium]|nr:1-deoxy-D-xylulose-5-phosphate reductoisomerase [Alphaproteobacteria bacterium]